jgi:hypothetical protein
MGRIKKSALSHFHPKVEKGHSSALVVMSVGSVLYCHHISIYNGLTVSVTSHFSPVIVYSFQKMNIEYFNILNVNVSKLLTFP